MGGECQAGFRSSFLMDVSCHRWLEQSLAVGRRAGWAFPPPWSVAAAASGMSCWGGCRLSASSSLAVRHTLSSGRVAVKKENKLKFVLVVTIFYFLNFIILHKSPWLSLVVFLMLQAGTVFLDSNWSCTLAEVKLSSHRNSGYVFLHQCCPLLLSLCKLFSCRECGSFTE